MHINPECGGAPGELLIVGPAEGSSQHQTLGWGANTGTLCCVVIWFGVQGLLINNVIKNSHIRINYILTRVCKKYHIV